MSYIYKTALTFVGVIQQTPPLFSAIKIDGKRAYDIARAGGTAEIKPKEITIYEFDITRIQLPEVDFRVVCSKGTYIRFISARPRFSTKQWSSPHSATQKPYWKLQSNGCNEYRRV